MDRSRLVVVVGTLEIVLGGVSALFALLGSLTAAPLFRSLPDGEQRWMLVPVLLGMLSYLVPAANLLVCGIGAVRFRRWARLANLISAGIWLALFGLSTIAVLGTAFFLSGPRGGVRPAEVAVMTVIGAILCALPVVVLVAFTRSGVRETFERRGAG